MDLWHADKRGVASVVTGAGKTALALLICADLWRAEPELRLVVVVPSLALLDQWVVALETELGVSPADIALFSGESKSARPGRANIAVINTARTLPARMFANGKNFFVVDECHRAGAPQNARALRIPAVYTLGLSATPVREFDDGFERYVEPALGPVIFEYDYVDAKRDGILSDFALHHFRIPLSETEVRQYQAGAGGETPRSWLAVDSPRRTAAAVGIVESNTGARIVFHERIATATEIARILSERGERVGLYHSHVSPSIRRRNLELFKVREFTTLVTCRALDEGVNVPDASVAVIAASTRSTRQRIQRLGRVLRPAPGKDLAVVATVYATQEEKIALEAEANTLAEVADVRWYEMAI
jgi:superfamily II DNA or RNA helicase